MVEHAGHIPLAHAGGPIRHRAQNVVLHPGPKARRHGSGRARIHRGRIDGGGIGEAQNLHPLAVLKTRSRGPRDADAGIAIGLAARPHGQVDRCGRDGDVAAGKAADDVIRACRERGPGRGVAADPRRARLPRIGQDKRSRTRVPIDETGPHRREIRAGQHLAIGLGQPVQHEGDGGRKHGQPRVARASAHGIVRMARSQRDRIGADIRGHGCGRRERGREVAERVPVIERARQDGEAVIARVCSTIDAIRIREGEHDRRGRHLPRPVDEGDIVIRRTRRAGDGIGSHIGGRVGDGGKCRAHRRLIGAPREAGRGEGRGRRRGRAIGAGDIRGRDGQRARGDGELARRPVIADDIIAENAAQHGHIARPDIAVNPACARDGRAAHGGVRAQPDTGCGLPVLEAGIGVAERPPPVAIDGTGRIHAGHQRRGGDGQRSGQEAEGVARRTQRPLRDHDGIGANAGGHRGDGRDVRRTVRHIR